MKNFLKSFYFAWRGIFAAFKSEKNLRIELAIGIYMIMFCWQTVDSPVELVVLFLCVALVLSLELVNSSIERLCDKITNEKCEHIKYVKDIAAGAVLIASIATVGSAIVLFFSKNRFYLFLDACVTEPWYGIIMIALAPIFIFFIVIDWNKA